MKNILIIGLGSIAKKHIKVLIEIDKTFCFYALRSSKNSKPYELVNDIYRFEELKNYNFDFAIISSPSVFHLKDLKRLSKLNIPLFVEKPLVTSKDQLLELQSIKFKNFVYVAHNIRFHSLVNILKSYLNSNPSYIYEINIYCGSFLPEWRKEYNSECYSYKEKMGGGVHLDLIHEPDYLIYLFGNPIKSKRIFSKISQIDGDSIDYCNLTFTYESYFANIILNYYRKDVKRTLEIVREKDTLKLDFVNQEIINLVDGQKIYSSKEDLMYNSYVDQMTYFLKCITKKSNKSNNLKESIQTLKLVL